MRENVADKETILYVCIIIIFLNKKILRNTFM